MIFLLDHFVQFDVLFQVSNLQFFIDLFLFMAIFIDLLLDLGLFCFSLGDFLGQLMIIFMGNFEFIS